MQMHLQKAPVPVTSSRLAGGFHVSGGHGSQRQIAADGSIAILDLHCLRPCTLNTTFIDGNPYV